jgi:NitT/TauT family transport system ATP-binding protein
VNPGTDSRCALRLERVPVGHQGRAVLRDLSVAIGEREILVVLGPSGCGKSTLLRTIAGLQAPLAGRVLVDGVPVRGPSGDRTLVFQDDGLLPWRTVRRNVELPLAIRRTPRAERRRQAASWLDRVGLTEAADRLPRQLSGGMRQRAQLARTLAGEPRLILMDEPFGALDTQTRSAMQQLLIEVWQRHPHTIVFVTHDVDEALAIGDRIAVLSDAEAATAALIEVPAPRAPHPDDPTYRDARVRIVAALGRTAARPGVPD